MKVKKIALITCITLFICTLFSVTFIGNASESPTLVEGIYVLQSQTIYEQNLGEARGLCVEGINSINGQSDATDLIVSGADGSASWRDLEMWYSNTSTGLPAHQSNYDDTIYGMEKVLASDGNWDLIYIQADTSAGQGYDRIVKQPGIQSSFYLSHDWYISTDSKPIALTLGDFGSPTGVEAAVVCEYGEVYIIRDHSGMSPSYVEVTDPFLLGGFSSWQYNHYYRYTKNMITSIADLDSDNPTYDDVVVGQYRNVTAISNNSSNQVIWSNEVLTTGYVCSVIAVPDQNGDTIEDVAVATSSSGLYLLSGADGTTLQSQGSIGNYFRDVQLFNSTHVITGNSDGDVILWDLTTGTIASTSDFGNDVKTVLNVGDVDSNGYDDFAVGGDHRVGVYNGNNMTLRWSDAPIGQAWLAPDYITVYDMCLMEDMVNEHGSIGATDGVDELAVIGFGDSSEDSAMFIYNSFGAWQFIPDLRASAYIVGGGDCFEDGNVEISATAYQSKGLPITAEIIIDGTHINIDPDSTDWASGVSYSYSQSFSNGEHTYGFEFIDGTDTYTIPERSFTIGNCGGGLDIPGAGIWMLFASAGIGIVISLYLVRKRINH